MGVSSRLWSQSHTDSMFTSLGFNITVIFFILCIDFNPNLSGGLDFKHKRTKDEVMWSIASCGFNSRWVFIHDLTDASFIEKWENGWEKQDWKGQEVWPSPVKWKDHTPFVCSDVGRKIDRMRKQKKESKRRKIPRH